MLDLSRAGMLLVAGVAAWLGGCGSGFERIDRHTTKLLAETNAGLGPETEIPRLDWPPGVKPDRQRGESITEYHPPTVNPTAEQLLFDPAGDANLVMRRLEQYAESPPDALQMDLNAALAYATAHSPGYRFAEEDYLLVALRLLIERHLWGPRFFDDVIASVDGSRNGGSYDTALRLINDLRITQRLPYGGDVSAQMLVSATEQLRGQVADGGTQTAQLIFDANIPLLRGAGMVAREDLIQAERNMVYAARDFERFRREFLFEITTDFLNLVVLQLAIKNAQQQVQSLTEFERRDQALAEAGRMPPFEAAITVQSRLFAIDRLNRQLETYRLTVDRFKVRIGMPEEQALQIVPSTPELPEPKTNLQEAVRLAMGYRLDLQNNRDEIDDARRGVNNARNALLPDLDLDAFISIPTDDSRDRAGLDFEFDDLSFRAALALGLPIDRKIERLNLRQSQIDLVRSIRAYEVFRDTVAVEVRSAVRSIDTARFSADLQEQNVSTARRRLASVEAAPDRATPRDRSETANELLAAQDDLLRAQRNLQVSILQYLLDSGQLRVEPGGSIRPLHGMELSDEAATGGAGS